MIESILKMPDGWLVILPSTSSDEDATDPEVLLFHGYSSLVN
jgi:hypothetical protein